LKIAVIPVQRALRLVKVFGIVWFLDFSSSAMPPVKREGSGAIGGRKAAKLFQANGPEAEAKVKSEECAQKVHQVNLERLAALNVAKDTILKHHIFSDILTAQPYGLSNGGHKADSVWQMFCK